ncbi:helix-turn-helix domain-containing protein [Salibacterium halotolerans]|nr:helix-turn-helix domain-containing protein [Salibacterium halotolerans]
MTKELVTKLDDLVNTITDISGIPAGFYSKDSNIISSPPNEDMKNTDNSFIFTFLHENAEAVETLLHDIENDCYYLSFWISVLRGFLLIGPYQTPDDTWQKSYLYLRNNSNSYVRNIITVSKHESLQTMSKSFLRYHFYHYPGALREGDWVTEDMLPGDCDAVYYPYQKEKQFLEYFKQASPESFALLTEVEETVDITLGSENPVRHLKNKLIIITTICTRVLIESGVTASEALTVSNGFLFSIEKTDSLRGLNDLHRKIVDSFYYLVQREKKNQYSPYIQEVRDFVHRNLREPLDVGTVVKHMQLSRGYLSTEFKKECCISLKQYILECKVEEAKRLILYSDKTLSDVSTLLCFNDQTYFTKVFKKFTGLTPLQYQKQLPLYS